MGKLPRGVRNIFNASVGAYRAEDDVWKIIAFKAEKERYLKAGLKGDELDQAAATIVRRTWPTFSMTPEAVNQFRRIGGFISFPSEVWRASYGTLKQIEEELASSNKAIRTIGAKRAAGAFAAITAGLGAAKATRAMYNISREEEDAIRTLSPPWNEHGSYVYAGRPKDGKYKYYDASNFLPHSYITDGFNALMRGEEWEETMFAVGASAIGPFVGGSPLASELLKGYVKSERAADFEHPMWKAAAKGITPGVVDQVLRVATGRTSGRTPIDRGTEIKAIVSGMRAVDRDATEDLSFLASGFNSRMTQQKGPLRRADVFGITSRVIGQIMPEKSMAALEEKTREAQLNTLAEMAQHTRAAMLVGVNESKVRAILKDKGISKANLEIIMTAAYAGVRR
jgi:hypothetical protein